MKDIYEMSSEIHRSINLYEKHLLLQNKDLRKRFPKEKQFMDERHELKKLIGNLAEDLQKLECFALSQDTTYSLLNNTKDNNENKF